MLLRANGGRVITGQGTSRLDNLVQQLWQSPVSEGRVRVVVDATPNPQWCDVETYWILPSLVRPQLLIPRGSSLVTSAALLRYRALRPMKTRLVRSALGAVTKLGIPPSLHRLSVQQPAGAELTPGNACLPLAAVEDCLQSGGLSAAIGIRLGDNRKPTLQLFDKEGVQAGYAKLAWNETSRGFIETEIASLNSVAGRDGPLRAPQLRGTGTWNGFPFLVTAPLPEKVRAVRGRINAPTPQELFALCPVHRFGSISSTQHFQALSERLRALPDEAEQDLRSATDEAELLIRRRNTYVPISVRWHGDLVPWNSAREPNGQLWCWDWESSEPDVVAGLDALHWTISVRREANAGTMASSLFPAVKEAGYYLRAAGLAKVAEADLAIVYALVVAERAWQLAAYNGGWPASWISQKELIDLLAAATGPFKPV